MGEPTVPSAMSEWIILIVAVIAAAFGFAIAVWSGTIFTGEQVYSSPEKIEKIYFNSSRWSDASSSGNITEVYLSIMNTGADELIISKVLINGTLLDSEEWESFPSMLFKPGDQGTLQITPSMIVFKEGTTYQFTIETVAGNSFLYSSVAEDDSFTFMQTEELKILSHSWSGTTYVDLNVKNTGSAALTMDNVQVNSGAAMAYDFDTGTAGNQSSQSVAAGASYTVRIWASYTSGVKYEFAITTAGGQKYTYVSTAP